jgi:MFS family permease
MSVVQRTVDTLPEPSKFYRWIVLIVVSIAMAGNYYTYDSINPLERIFTDQLNFSASQFGWLNASYSLAAVCTLLIGGILIDRFGLRKALFLFSALCVAGAILTALKGNFYLMVTGRTVLGLGAESQIVAVTVALARWFKGKELSFAFGINLTIARLASIAADNQPRWATFAFYPNGINAAPSWQRPLMLTSVISLLAVIGALIYWIMEVHAEARYHLGKSGEPDKLSFREGLKFNPSYWYAVALCFTFYSGIFPFRTFAIDLFTSKILGTMGAAATAPASFVLAQQRAGSLNSLLPLSAMIATPIFGLIADKIGRRATLMMFGSLLMVPVYLMIAYAHISLLVPVSMMGIAFSLIPAVIWPSIAYIVDEARLGTAYALMSLLQQIGFFIFNLAIGTANDISHASPQNPGGYALGMWIFSILGFVAFFFSFLLYKRETGPQGHGLETITAGSPAAA